MSTPKGSHTFKYLIIPQSCYVCDTMIFRNGKNCSECGVKCHNDCMSRLLIQCGSAKLPPRIKMFGMELSCYLEKSKTQIPGVLQKCIKEIEARGKHTKGIYRTSGVKNKIKELKNMLEYGEDLVDLSQCSPFVIADVLKLYLIELPEPLLTFHLYRDFLSIAQQTNTTDKMALQNIRKLLDKLPPENYNTLAMLITHLEKVSNEGDVNGMNKKNIGIVFGPTLFRSSNETSMEEFEEMGQVTKITHMMVKYARRIFKVENETKEEASNSVKTDISKEDDELPDTWFANNVASSATWHQEMSVVIDSIFNKYKTSEEVKE